MSFANEQYYLELTTPNNEDLNLVKLNKQGLEMCKRFKTEQILGRKPTLNELVTLMDHAVNVPANSTFYAVASQMSHIWTARDYN